MGRHFLGWYLVSELRAHTQHKQVPLIKSHDLGASRGRLLGALMAAWAAAVGVAFVAGCVHAVHATALGLTEIVLSVGTITAIAAAPIALVAVFALALPIFGFWISRDYSSAFAYVGAGALIVAVTGMFVAGAHYFGGFLLSKDFSFALATIAIAGPAAALVVWLVIRSD